MIYKGLMGGLAILMQAYLFCVGAQNQDSEALLILNMRNEPILPLHFRTTNDPFNGAIASSPSPIRQGLNSLNLSGSAQFSQESLNEIVKHLGSPESLYVIDLREESHGFLNGAAVSWRTFEERGNRGKTLQEIEQEERRLLEGALIKRDIFLHQLNGQQQTIISIPFKVDRAATEQEIVARLGFSYLRIPVGDNAPLSNNHVDRFITFIRTLPRTRWIHIHDARGEGRTTIFMMMYDMMMNAKEVSFNDILERQWLIGGLNLREMNGNRDLHIPIEEHLFFLKNFYDYCRYNKDQFQQLWSTYALKNLRPK